MPALKDLLSEKDQKKVESWANQARAPLHQADIPPELYQMALHGAYFGFEAVEAILRGHIIDIDEDGKVRHIPYTFETMVGLNQAARKVRYRQIIDEGDIAVAAKLGAQGDKSFATSAVQKRNKIVDEVARAS